MARGVARGAPRPPCSATPFFSFSDAGGFYDPNPAGYAVDPNFYAVLPNATILSGSTLIGYRHVINSTTNCEGQFAFTVTLDLP